MKKKPSKFLENSRITEGDWASHPGGLIGAYKIKYSNQTSLRVIAHDGNQKEWDASKLPGSPWEHVSVAPIDQDRTPTWAEMNWVKGLFWDETETVLQLHVPKERYVNKHPYVLHLWKPKGREIPLPPQVCV